MWEKGYFFHLNYAISHKRVFFVILCYVVRQISTMHVQCSNVTTTRRRQEENHTKKMYYNCNECPQFVSKGVITQCALLEIGKRGDFSYNKSPRFG